MHKRVRKVEGRLEGQVQHLPIGLCLVSCRTSKWVTVGLMLLLMVANGSMWVFVGLCGSLWACQGHCELTCLMLVHLSDLEGCCALNVNWLKFGQTALQ